MPWKIARATSARVAEATADVRRLYFIICAEQRKSSFSAVRTAAHPGKIKFEKAAPLASIATAKIKYNYALKLEEIY
jgi:hypothetical protein